MLAWAEHPSALSSPRSSSFSRRTCSPRRGLTLLELIVVMAVLVALATMVVPILDNFATESRMTATKQTLVRLQETINNRYATDMKGVTFYDSSNNPVVNQGLPVPNPTPANTVSGRIGNPYYPQLAFFFIEPTWLTQSTATYTGSLGWHGPYTTAGGALFPYATQMMPNGRTASVNGFYGSDGTSAIYGFNGNTASTSGAYADPTVADAWGSPIVIQPVATSSVSGPFSFATYSMSGSTYGTTPLLDGTTFLTLTN
ncbi:MAG TPA: prepilin-type N-terminal cleavage/methylation domain-containing protein, partial [Pirellulales bacterium]|nr:prepilin-type N-terminal cleavage/methylation domain-containing protein [Pirellulales bacterium]